MLLVVDANELFSALIARGTTLDLFFNPEIKYAAPAFLRDEWKEHQEEISKKASISLIETRIFFILLTEKIQFTPTEGLKEHLAEAELLAHDLDDVEYLALALKLNCPIWSEDKDMKRQSKIKVFTTTELLKELANVKM